MKYLRTISCASVVLLLAANFSRADFITYANLLGANEVPANGSTADGSATVTYEAGLNDLLYHLTYGSPNPLLGNASLANIHFGGPAVAGPVIFSFTPSPSGHSGILNGVLTASDLNPSPGNGINTFADAVSAILAGNTYVNVHTTVFPGGEIRGQLLVPEPGGLLLLSLGGAGLALLGARRRRAAR